MLALINVVEYNVLQRSVVVPKSYVLSSAGKISLSTPATKRTTSVDSLPIITFPPTVTSPVTYKLPVTVTLLCRLI